MIESKTANPQAIDESTLLQQMVDALRAAGEPERVILFGSRARGDARPDSDFDLLIVQAAQSGASRWQELRRLRQAFRSPRTSSYSARPSLSAGANHSTMWSVVRRARVGCFMSDPEEAARLLRMARKDLQDHEGFGGP